MVIRLEKLSATQWALMNDNDLLAEINGSTINIRGTTKMGADLISPSATELAALDGLTATSTELNKAAGVVAGTTTASKNLVVGANKNVDVLALPVGGLKIGTAAGTAVDATAAELNMINTSVAGTAVASKALVLGANKNIDVLAIADSGLSLGAGAGTAVTKTAAQLNLMVAGVAGGYKLARGAVALDGSNPTTVATGLATIIHATASIKRTTALGTGTAFITVDFTGSDGNLDLHAWILAGTASVGTETVLWDAIGT